MVVSKWLPIITVLLIYVARMTELRARRRVQPGQISQRWTLHWFVFCGTFMLICSLSEFHFLSRSLFWPSYLAGIAASFLSIYLRRRAIAELGEFWSLHNELRDNHRFVCTGPFRVVRHPTYLSMILELVGGALILNAYFSLGVVLLLLLPALWLRIQGEELQLRRKFGESYEKYQQQVSAVFPLKFPQHDAQNSS